MAAALECWSGRPSTDEDTTEQTLMSNPHRSHLSSPQKPPKKWHRLLQTLKTSITTTTKLPQWSTQLPDNLISDLRRHFDLLPSSYALVAFPITAVLLHLRLFEQAAAAHDHLAVHIHQDELAPTLTISFACGSSISVPAASNMVDGACRKVQVFESKGGMSLGVMVVENRGGDKEVMKGRIESALRCATKKPKKVPFGLCGCQGADEDGLVIQVDEWQNVNMSSNEWMIDCKEVEFGDQIGANSYKGLYRGKRVWIKRMKGCERGSAYEVEIRCDLARVMSCGHRNLVELVGVCVEERYGLCVVTRMVEGGSVRDLIERRRKVEGKEVVRIALDVVEGLMFMNGHGVAYRDLNVSRILLDREGNALLGDMGIVASCSNGGEVTEYETAGYRWLAPEVSESHFDLS